MCRLPAARLMLSIKALQLPGTVVRQWDKPYSGYGSRQTLTSPWDSVLIFCLMKIARARFLSDTTHFPMLTSEPVCRTTVPEAFTDSVDRSFDRKHDMGSQLNLLHKDETGVGEWIWTSDDTEDQQQQKVLHLALTEVRTQTVHCLRCTKMQSVTPLSHRLCCSTAWQNT